MYRLTKYFELDALVTFYIILK